MLVHAPFLAIPAGKLQVLSSACEVQRNSGKQPYPLPSGIKPETPYACGAHALTSPRALVELT